MKTKEANGIMKKERKRKEKNHRRIEFYWTGLLVWETGFSAKWKLVRLFIGKVEFVFIQFQFSSFL